MSKSLKVFGQNIGQTQIEIRNANCLPSNIPNIVDMEVCESVSYEVYSNDFTFTISLSIYFADDLRCFINSILSPIN